MKFNMGCGFNKMPGYINIDKWTECAPDKVMDLEQLPWNIESNSADEVFFNHAMEHIGSDPATFMGIMKEIYRIARPNARIAIVVPHPRHDYFLGDPTHVRVITPYVLSLFSKANNLQWQAVGASNSQFALALNVDFETEQVEQVLEPRYLAQVQSGVLSEDDLHTMIQERNNIVQEYRFLLRVRKDT